MIYRGKNCMKNFCESLREQAMKIINLRMKKKKKLLKIEQQESYKNAEFCYMSKESFKNKYVEDKKYRKLRDHCN